jgi:preprotein translocase subunit YajC
MTDLLSLLIAQGEGGGQPQGNMASFLIPLVLMFAVMYFMVIRPTNKQRREQMEMLTRLQKNDRVITSAGIIGIVVSIKENEDEVTLKTGDQDTRISVLRSTIVRILTAHDTTPKTT